jgi:D-glycero-D-manno-heptose 1,7-bisphosphate phosphatase
VSDAGRPAVFLDRDGVINALVPHPPSAVPESPYRPVDVEILAGAPEALLLLRDGGFELVVASNQPASAKRIATAADLDAVHARIVDLLGPAAAAVGEWRYCHHHPDAADPALRECDCRKPKPGLLTAAAAELGLALDRSWMVGDGDRDVEAGRAAGCSTALIEHPDSAHMRTGAAHPDLTAPDLLAAADAIRARSR